MLFRRKRYFIPFPARFFSSCYNTITPTPPQNCQIEWSVSPLLGVLLSFHCTFHCWNVRYRRNDTSCLMEFAAPTLVGAAGAAIQKAGLRKAVLQGCTRWPRNNFCVWKIDQWDLGVWSPRRELWKIICIWSLAGWKSSECFLIFPKVGNRKGVRDFYGWDYFACVLGNCHRKLERDLWLKWAVNHVFFSG